MGVEFDILRHREGIFEQFHVTVAGPLVIVHANHVESPAGRSRKVPQVFACHAAQFVLFVVIYGGFGRFHVMRGPRLDFDKTQHVPLPALIKSISPRRLAER